MNTQNAKSTDSIPFTKGFNFNFTLKQDGLFIEVSNEFDVMQYFGTILPHPNIDFELLQHLLQKGQFTVLSRNENFFKIKAGPMVIQTTSKFKQEIENLQRENQKLIQSKRKLQTQVMKIEEKYQELSQISKQVPQILLVESPIKWCQKSKSTFIKINERFITKTNHSLGLDFALLSVGLSQKSPCKQRWAIKIKRKTGEIFIGICLKNHVQKAGFSNQNVVWKSQGHGCFAISSDGWGYSSKILKDIGNQRQSFKFYNTDVIFCEYDPMNKRLTMKLNQQVGDIWFTIPDPPKNDAYYPFVALKRENSSVQLLLPGEKSDQNFLSRLIKKCIYN